MEQWIPFEEGSYMTESAFLVTKANKAVSVENTVVKVTERPDGRRTLSGMGQVAPYLISMLSDDDEDLDLILDFGGTYKYRLKNPRISAGKIFSQNVKAMMQFVPSEPWVGIPVVNFEKLINNVRFL